jgi:hypothetical protein
VSTFSDEALQNMTDAELKAAVARAREENRRAEDVLRQRQRARDTEHCVDCGHHRYAHAIAGDDFPPKCFAWTCECPAFRNGVS